MKPEEKAKELFDKYFLLNESGTDEKGVWFIIALNKGLAKKCALIAVEELIDNIEDDFLENDLKYWQEVKNEIQKL